MSALYTRTENRWISKDPAQLELSGACIGLNWRGGQCGKGSRNPSFAQPLRRSKRAVPVSQHRESLPPASAVRALLLACARACAEARLPLPQRHELAAAIGCSERQLHRHLDALRDCGSIVTRRGRNCAYVIEVAA